MEVHPAAATDDRRALIRVQAVHGREPDQGGPPGRDRPRAGADLKGGAGEGGVGGRAVGLAVEPCFAGVVAGLNLDQADAQPGVAVGVEGQGAGDVDRPDGLINGRVKCDCVAGADLDAVAGPGRPAPLPRRRPRPRPARPRADQRSRAGDERHQKDGGRRDRAHERTPRLLGGPAIVDPINPAEPLGAPDARPTPEKLMRGGANPRRSESQNGRGPGRNRFHRKNR